MRYNFIFLNNFEKKGVKKMKEEYEKKSNSEKSMLDIFYEILKKKKKPMPIMSTIEEVFKIKKIDIQEKEKIAQLYLDIVLSGCFVFHGNSFWSTKENHLNLWDQEYFDSNYNEENNIEIKNEEIENKIVNFDDFMITKNELEENSEEEKDHLEEELYLDLNNDSNISDDIDTSLNNKEEKEDNKDIETEEYDY
jgi:DNA-directed RNA polymerase subunit delta